MSLSVLSPIAEPGVPITPYAVGIDPSTFTGTIGFFANSQPGSKDFLASLAPRMLELLPGATAVFEDKGHTPQASSMLMSDVELKHVLDICDAAVLAYGHCGSCTSATVRDAVQLARLGLPVVATVAPSFAPEAVQVARAAGMPDVPIHIFATTMKSRTIDERAQVAAEIAPTLLEMLSVRP